MVILLYLDRFIPGVGELDAALRDSASVRADHVLAGRRSSPSPRIWLFAFVHIRGVGPGPLR